MTHDNQDTQQIKEVEDRKTPPKTNWLKDPYGPMEKGSTMKSLLLYTLYLVLPGIILSLLAVIALQIGSRDIANISMIGSIMTYAGMLGVYRLMFKEWPHKLAFNFEKGDVPFILKCYFVMMLGNILINVIAVPTSAPANQQALETMFSTGNLILFGLYTVVLAPLVEELLFRQVFFKGLFPKMSGIVVAVANVVIFTSLHTGTNFLADPTATLQYVWLSVVLVFSFAKTRRLSTSYGLHLLNNGIAFGAMLLSSFIH